MMEQTLPLHREPARSLNPNSRRSSRRPVLFAYVQLGHHAGGVIVNISEGGLCVQTTSEVPLRGLLQVRFHCFQSDGWMEAQARVAWANDTKLLAGIEFVDLTPAALQEIRKWLLFGAQLEELRDGWAAAAGKHHSVEPESKLVGDAEARPNKELATERLFYTNEGLANDATRVGSGSCEESPAGIFSVGPENTGGSRRSLVTAVCVILLIAVTVAFWTGRKGELTITRIGQWRGSISANMTHLIRPVRTFSVHAVPMKVAAVQPSLQLTTRPVVPSRTISTPSQSATGTGFMLQVAAMSRTENARKLAEMLLEKNLPAFVLKSPKDSYYRVAIGPYDSSESVAQARAVLHEVGLEGIKKRWSQ
jgi:SPOR domain/PilZ domain